MPLPPLFRALALALVSVALAGAALAQGTQVRFGDGQNTSGQPVEVTSDQLEFDQQNGTALFTGSVRVVQGALRLTAERVDVTYGDNEAGDTEVRRVEATGNVVLINGEDAAEGERAVYTLADGTVVMTGDVLLTRPESAITGERLSVNVDDGTGVMEGRVSVVFTPEEGDGG
ncbi:MAG: lipopolysaccharide transport periplasmic protein LptA [Paracoccaceae bacterium]|jgi:lipopolysaccharide export system protein LptA|nr:lipopolysaccharide transport periplasmic protein LptA [Paracoccaceae bacterium]